MVRKNGGKMVYFYMNIMNLEKINIIIHLLYLLHVIMTSSNNKLLIDKIDLKSLTYGQDIYTTLIIIIVAGFINAYVPPWIEYCKIKCIELKDKLFSEYKKIKKKF